MTDCGLFVLHNTELILRNPSIVPKVSRADLKSVALPYRTLHWFYTGNRLASDMQMYDTPFRFISLNIMRSEAFLD
jgi:Ulp1 family protease